MNLSPLIGHTVTVNYKINNVESYLPLTGMVVKEYNHVFVKALTGFKVAAADITKILKNLKLTA